MPFPNYCIACNRRHIDCEENEVVVYNQHGVGLVTYHKSCVELAKKMTVEGLIARGYTGQGVASQIVEGIA